MRSEVLDQDFNLASTPADLEAQAAGATGIAAYPECSQLLMTVPCGTQKGNTSLLLCQVTDFIRS